MTNGNDNLREILRDWDNVKPEYDEFCEYVKAFIEDLLKEQGLSPKVYSRTKDKTSLAIKLITKNYELCDKEKKNIEISFDDYSRLTDKVGFRIVCRFKDEIDEIEKIIKSNFVIVKCESKIDFLKYYQMGYKSLHFDIKLDPDGILPIESNGINLANIIGEIQVRTMCEDVWAEINHDIAYKSLVDISDSLKRQIHCLCGLLEVADDYINDINSHSFNDNPLNPRIELKILQKPFIKYVQRSYNREFSLKNLDLFSELINNISSKEFYNSINEFIEKNERKIENIFKKRTDEILDKIPYFLQPEIIFFFYQIETNKRPFGKKWVELYSKSDLEALGYLWGVPIDDFVLRE